MSRFCGLLGLAPAALLALTACGPARAPSSPRPEARRGATSPVARPSDALRGDAPRRAEAARPARPRIATATITAAIGRNPNQPVLHFVLGKRHHDAGRLDDAEVGYRNAAHLKADYFEPRYNLGILFVQRKRYAEAARWFGRAAALRPADQDTQEKLVMCLIHAGDLAGAEKALKGFASRPQKGGQVYYLLGVVAQRQRKPAQALGWYRRALRAGHDGAELHNRMGGILRSQKQLAAALAAFRAALAKEPGYGLAHANLGGLLLTRGDYAGAFKHLQAAAEKLPTNGSVQVNLGLAGLRLGQIEVARLALERAVKLKPELLLARLGLGVALLFGGQVPRGAALLMAAVGQQKSLAGTLGSYFQPLLDRNNCPGAVALLEAIVLGQPANAVARKNLAIMRKRCPK